MIPMRRLAPFVLAALLAGVPAGADAQGRRGGPGLDSLLARARRDSLDARAAFELGMAWWGRRRYDRADSAFQRALTLAPQYAEPRLAAALLPYGRGQRYLTDLAHRITADSLAALERRWAALRREAYLLDPLVDPRILRLVPADHLVPRRVLGASDDAPLLAPPPLWWEGRTKRAVQELAQGRADRAYALLEEVRGAPRMQQGAVLPDLFVWYYALAALHAGRFEHAAAAFRELSQRTFRREPDRPDEVIPGGRAEALYFYGVASLKAQHAEVAAAAFQAAIDADLGLYQAHARLADLHEAAGDLDRALVERTRALEVEPEDGRLHLDLGATLLRARRPTEAEAALAEAARLLPNDPEAQRLLADAALRNGHTERARTALERFLVVAPARAASQVAEARRRLAELR